MKSAQRFNWSAARTRWVLAALLSVSFLLYLVPLTWGLPSRRGWAPDEIGPQAVLKAAAHAFSGGWTTRYPPLHYYLLDTIYQPLRWLAASSRLALDAGELYHLYFLAGRLLSVLLATATVYLVYRVARELNDRFTSCLAAGAAATMAPLAYYAKTVNLEAPYLFWFALSLLFFLRLLRRQRLLDYLAFASTGICALSTKDQAYALYVLPAVLVVVALHRHRRVREGSGASGPGTLFDRRLLWSALVSLLLFAAIHRLPFDLAGFHHHIAEMRRVSVPSSEFDRSLPGYVSLAWSGIRHTAFILGLPLFLAALAGVGSFLGAKHRDARGPALLVFVVSYGIFFIALVRYNYDRFYLPVGLVMSIFAGVGLSRLLRWRSWPTAVARALLVVVFGLSAGRAASVDAMMLADSRYAAEAWLASHLRDGETAVGLGSSVKLQPRGPQNIPWAGKGGRTPAEWLERYDAAIAIVHPENVGRGTDARRCREFWLGDMNFRPLATVRGRPAFNLLTLGGVRSNLTKLNAEILIAERESAWGPTGDELLLQAVEAAGGATPGALERVERQIVDGPVPGRRQLLGAVVVALSGDHHRPISADRPAVVVVSNPGRRPLRLELSMALVDPAAAPPAVIRIAGPGGSSRRVVAGGPPTAVPLQPVPGRSSRLFVLTSEEGPDVLLRTVVRRFLTAGVWAAGLGPDLWSRAGDPVVVVVENPDPDPRVVDLEIETARGRRRPLRLTIDGERTHTSFRVPAAGGAVRSLPAAVAYARSTYLLSAPPAPAGEADRQPLRFRVLPTAAAGQ